MDKIVLVHLSDIHFTGSSGPLSTIWMTKFETSCCEMRQRLRSGFGGTTGVLVTGDIAFSGQKVEYDEQVPG